MAQISSLLTLSEWEELKRTIEAVASRPHLKADLSITDSEYEDYPDSQTLIMDLNLLDDTTLDELYTQTLIATLSWQETQWIKSIGATQSTFQNASGICNSQAVQQTVDFGRHLEKQSNRSKLK